MSKYKTGDVVRVILEPSELNKKHFITNHPKNIPLKLGQTYRVIGVGKWADGEVYLNLYGTSSNGREFFWEVLPSAVAPPFTVEEELD